jgi:hypothetical protein
MHSRSEQYPFWERFNELPRPLAKALKVIFQFDQLRSSLPQFDASLLMSFASELRALNLLWIQEGAALTRWPKCDSLGARPFVAVK